MARTSLFEISLQIFLGGQGYWGYIDGSFPAPDFYEELEKYQKWRQVNAKIVSVILKSVESQGLSVAMETFEFLKRVYQQSNKARKYQIGMNIFNYKQGDKTIQDTTQGSLVLWSDYELICFVNATGSCCIAVMKMRFHEQKECNSR